jgi:hypothetical protein
MRPTEFLRQTLLWLRYRNAAFVNSRDELDAALNKAPPRIVVDGDEALRAYAATIAAPDIQSGTVSRSAALLAVPPIGRIRDGYRRRTRRTRLVSRSAEAGLPLVLLAMCGTMAGLLAEWISYITPWPHPPGQVPAGLHPRATSGVDRLLPWSARLAILLLGLAALACFGCVLWQALSIGLPRRTEWRVEYRIPGRLVMVRLKRRTAV